MRAKLTFIIATVFALSACDNAPGQAGNAEQSDEIFPPYARTSAANPSQKSAAEALAVQGRSIGCSRSAELLAQIEQTSRKQIRFAANGDILIGTAAWRALPENAKMALLRLAESAVSCSARPNAPARTLSVLDPETGKVITTR